MAIYGQDAQTRSSSTLDGFNVQLPHMRPASLLHRHVLMLILHLLLLSGRLATPWLPWTRSRCQKKTVIATFIDSYSAIIDFDSCGWHCFFFSFEASLVSNDPTFTFITLPSTLCGFPASSVLSLLEVSQWNPFAAPRHCSESTGLKKGALWYL